MLVSSKARVNTWAWRLMRTAVLLHMLVKLATIPCRIGGSVLEDDMAWVDTAIVVTSEMRSLLAEHGDAAVADESSEAMEADLVLRCLDVGRELDDTLSGVGAHVLATLGCSAHRLNVGDNTLIWPRGLAVHQHSLVFIRADNVVAHCVFPSGAEMNLCVLGKHKVVIDGMVGRCCCHGKAIEMIVFSLHRPT